MRNICKREINRTMKVRFYSHSIAAANRIGRNQMVSFLRKRWTELSQAKGRSRRSTRACCPCRSGQICIRAIAVGNISSRSHTLADRLPALHARGSHCINTVKLSVAEDFPHSPEGSDSLMFNARTRVTQYKRRRRQTGCRGGKLLRSTMRTTINHCRPSESEFEMIEADLPWVVERSAPPLRLCL